MSIDTHIWGGGILRPESRSVCLHKAQGKVGAAGSQSCAGCCVLSYIGHKSFCPGWLLCCLLPVPTHSVIWALYKARRVETERWERLVRSYLVLFQRPVGAFIALPESLLSITSLTNFLHPLRYMQPKASCLVCVNMFKDPLPAP